jgi:uncharacterized protein YaaN involved in tellurite resistance
MDKPANQLAVFDQESLKRELQFADPTNLKLEPQEDNAIAEQADGVVTRLLDSDPRDAEMAAAIKQAIEEMGMELQQEAGRQSKMLKQPIASLSTRAEDGGEVANALIDLKMQVEELDPAGLDLKSGWLTRLLGNIPGFGTPLKRYFSRYESASTVIDAILDSLRKGQDQLKKDNISLLEDQTAMRALTHKLEKSIRLGQLIDQRLEDKITNEIPTDDPRHKFISEELLFPLRQRIQDLQQQLLVNQQGFLTIEMVIRNNKELIRGVDRASNVTVSALQVAVTLALALANQKIVLDKINAVSKTTDNLIAGTAERLRTQGVEIHKQASSTQLDMDTLKKAFEDVRYALDDVSRYRQEALPKMANSIKEMEQLSQESEETIQRMERANRAAKSFPIEILD